MTYTNTRVTLASRPVGLPHPDNLAFDVVDIPPLVEGQILIKNHFISIEPAMRGWMNSSKSYIPPIALGEVFRAMGAGQVVESRHPAFAVGDYVTGDLKVQQFAVHDGDSAQDPTNPGTYLLKVDTTLASLETHLATLGLPGLTAYFGLLGIGQPRAGETVVVSGAAGAVGSVVGSIAKLKGCRVIGLVGNQEKIDYCVQKLGFDACLNYKDPYLRAALRTACPRGIDVYFDNAGGDLLDWALERLALRGRVVLCGAISQYNTTGAVKGPANYLSLLINRGRMEGLVVLDSIAQFPTATREMASWLREGHLVTPKVQVEKGIDNFLATLLKLFSGQSFGKLLLTP
ncbi:NADP-dependent oxidoreductase [Hymenobacter sp. NST-14]|uniref:NADP-dependent oxidoreductase n=1 Tax=Hymenobacter piscis TaxID=2839984 RepID=UPI001C037229|nr:NADP-dependent oxidoreductase [Hymenobacter piscis]MBT9395461.1 NADP-dependent oxidoreductase [Hymenobacter piscis]